MGAPIAIAQLDLNVRTWLHESRERVIAAMATKLAVSTKTGRNDLVTNVDKANQEFLISRIKQVYPAAHIEGEEGTGAKTDELAGLIFFVDPIDGTMNFVKQQANFAIMIGVYENGVPLYGAIMDVMADEVITGGPDWPLQLNQRPLPNPADRPLVEGLLGVNGPLLMSNELHVADIAKASSGPRIIGSAGLEFMAIAKGQTAGYISYLQPWDFAAGMAIGAGYGLIVTKPDGDPLNPLQAGLVVAALPLAHETILEMMNEIEPA